jgi:hypothetical protein
LVALGHGGNHDCQYIDNASGAAEYVACYNSKQDEPDLKLIDNLYASKIAKLRLRKDTIEYQDHLRVITNAVYAAQQIGTVQACYTLLQLPFVQSSRTVMAINCLRRTEMPKSIIYKKGELDQLDPQMTAELKGPNSSIGRREAYQCFVKQQHQLARGDGPRRCFVSLFSLYSSYSVKMKGENDKSRIRPPPLLEIDDRGFIINPVRFLVGSYIFAVRRQKAIVNMSPFVPIDLGNERSCYTILLMHVPWPEGGEDFIVPADSTAVQMLIDIRKNGLAPKYLNDLLARQILSQAHIGDYATEYQNQQSLSDLNDMDDNIRRANESEEDDDDVVCDASKNDSDIDSDSDSDSKESLQHEEKTSPHPSHFRTISGEEYEHMGGFIDKMREKFNIEYSAGNQISITDKVEVPVLGSDGIARYQVEDHNNRVQKLAEDVAKLERRQRAAYDMARDRICGVVNA